MLLCYFYSTYTHFNRPLSPLTNNPTKSTQTLTATHQPLVPTQTIPGGATVQALDISHGWIEPIVVRRVYIVCLLACCSLVVLSCCCVLHASSYHLSFLLFAPFVLGLCPYPVLTMPTTTPYHETSLTYPAIYLPPSPPVGAGSSLRTQLALPLRHGLPHRTHARRQGVCLRVSVFACLRVCMFAYLYCMCFMYMCVLCICV